jgi:hypothetical protein
LDLLADGKNRVCGDWWCGPARARLAAGTRAGRSVVAYLAVFEATALLCAAVVRLWCLFLELVLVRLLAVFEAAVCEADGDVDCVAAKAKGRLSAAASNPMPSFFI